MSSVTLLDHLVNAGEALWRASWQASVLAVLIGGIHLVVGRHIAPRWRHAMWMLVLVRLALPVVPSSPISMFNLAPANASPAPAMEVEAPLQRSRSHGKTLDLPSPSRPRVEMMLVEDTVSPEAVTEQASAAVPVPTTDLETKSASISWPRVAVSIWLVIAGLMAMRVLWATLRVGTMIRRLTRVSDAAVKEILAAAAREMHVRRAPVLLAGDGLFSPALVGFIRPKLLLPSDLLAQFEPAELRLIFLHELAHLKRRDVAINWAATILSILHWPNPIVWLAVRRLRLERELACDELVVSRASDTERRAYGHTIVKLLETFSRGVSPMPGSVGILEGKQQMKRRITMIARFAKRNRGWSVIAGVLLVGLSACALTDGAKAKPNKPGAQPAKSAVTSTTRPIVPATKPADPMALASVIDLFRPTVSKKGAGMKPGDIPPNPPADEIASLVKESRSRRERLKELTTIAESPSATEQQIAQFMEARTATQQAIVQLRDKYRSINDQCNVLRRADRDQALQEKLERWEAFEDPLSGEMDEQLRALVIAEAAILKRDAKTSGGAPVRDVPATFETKAKDYAIGPNDLVSIAIFDLEGPGKQTIKQGPVSATGKIILPYLNDPVSIAGLTEDAARKAIAKEYVKSKVLDNPTIDVSVTEAKNLPPKPSTISVDELMTVTVADLMGNGVDAIKTSRVDADGKISFPYAGEVTVAGLKPEQAQAEIATALEKAHVMMKPVVVVSLPDRGESHTLRVKRDEKVVSPTTAPAEPTAAERVTAAAMDRSLPEVNFDGAPFSDVIEFLRDVTKMNFAIDWRALESAGIDRNSPVSLKLKNIALKDVLTIMLRQLGSGLTFKAEAGVIQITMAEPAAAAVETRAYDVSDLLPDSLPEGESFQARTTQLADVITQNVRPESWRKPNHPGENSATVFGVKVVVSASAEVHGEVEKLLKMLRDRPAQTTRAPRAYRGKRPRT